MSDRDRLVELLKEADDATEVHDCDYLTYEKAMQAFYTSIADHLLANGVIVLPCAVGNCDYIYYADEEVSKVYVLDADEIHISKMPTTNRILFTIDGFEFFLEDFGKIVFLTKEEAEAKLVELKGE